MNQTTLSAGARVALGTVRGYVREVSAPSVNSVLVEFDKPIPGQFTRHAFVWASDLALIDDDPIEGHDAANGALWPRTIEEVCDFAVSLDRLPSEVIGALETMRANRPDYAALEAASLGEAFNDPTAGGDL
jgi:hypothetical protein